MMEFSDFNSYFYNNSNTLKNKLGIRNQIKLEQVVNEFATNNMAEILGMVPPKLFNPNYLKQVHRRLLGDVYDWAEEFRTCPMARNQTYCDPSRIQEELNLLCLHFNVRFMRKFISDKGDLADDLADFWGKINAIYPFRDGNGRSQYVFFTKACQKKGYDLTFSSSDLKNLRNARDLASTGNPRLLSGMIERGLSELQPMAEKVKILEQRQKVFVDDVDKLVDKSSENLEKEAP